jgi:hypothetical protein
MTALQQMGHLAIAAPPMFARGEQVAVEVKS